MNIIQTFLDLTKKTYPHGTEHLLEPFLPKDIQKDKFGNYFHVVGDGSSRVIFASHLDTVSSTYDDVIHTFNKNGSVVGTDGNTTLGADDKAGVTIMLYMIENNIPGLYYFFVGEEVGCIGSGKVSREKHIFNKENYDKVISFDRRGNTSIITHQSAMRCCSEEFAEELCDQLNSQGLGMETDDGGVCTDSLEFIDDIPECTNVSVGYLDEHTGNETQDLDFLEKICKASIKVDWEGLPVKRDPSVTEYKKSKRSYNNSWDSWKSWNRETPTRHKYPSPLRDINERRNFPSMNDRLEDEKLALIYGYYNEDENGFYDDDDLPMDRSNPLIDSNFGPFRDYEDEDEDLNNLYEMDVDRNIYFDSLENPLHIGRSNDRKRYFDSLKDKYLDDRITEDEIDMIKDQMLDIDDPVDAAFMDEIDELISIKNNETW